MEQWEGAVWPPPPQNPATLGLETVEVMVGFRTEFRVVEGSAPNFRQGAVRLSPEGILLEGQAVMPYERQLPVFILGLFLPPLWMIAYLMMEYGMRHTELLSLSWGHVRRIACVGEEQLVCIVYEARNFQGKDKVHSLAFPLNEEDYDAFLACARLCRSEKVGEANVRHWTSPICWAFWTPTLTLGVISVLCMVLAGAGVVR